MEIRAVLKILIAKWRTERKEVKTEVCQTFFSCVMDWMQTTITRTKKHEEFEIEFYWYS